MAYQLPQPIQDVIDELSRLPGIGPKTASRLTFYLLTLPEDQVKQFGDALLKLQRNLKKCPECFNITLDEKCSICDDPERDPNKILVVEEPLDLIALEKTGYDGRYHVLGGVISPIAGIGPEDLHIQPLLDKIQAHKDTITEVILATNPSLEGEATALYILERLKPVKVKVTRIARGLPIGGELEYADELTLQKALEGRKVY